MTKSKDADRRSVPQGMLGRRDFLCLGAATAAALVMSPVAAKTIPATERQLRFRNLHTGEATTAVYWSDGIYLPDGMQEINSVLRDHRTDEVHPMDNDLLNFLYVLQRSVGSQKSYEVISGYRSPATNESLRNKSSGVAKRSYHMQGKAIDIRLPGCDLKKLQQAALELKAGGVGYYPKSGFIHVDVGPARSW